MAFDPRRHRRRSTRLSGYDYSQPNVYSVTVCAARRGNCFGRLDGPRVALNWCGVLVRDSWLALPERFTHVALDRFVVMPDHFHGLLEFGPIQGSAPREPLGKVMAFWKWESACAVTAWRAERHGAERVGIWQRGFHDHIVRDQEELEAIRLYIEQNPLRAFLKQQGES